MRYYFFRKITRVLSLCLIVSFVSCDFNLKKEEDKPEQKQEQEEKPSEEKKRIETAARRKRLKEIADQNRKRLY